MDKPTYPTLVRKICDAAAKLSVRILVKDRNSWRFNDAGRMTACCPAVALALADGCAPTPAAIQVWLATHFKKAWLDGFISGIDDVMPPSGFDNRRSVAGYRVGRTVQQQLIEQHMELTLWAR